MFSSAAIKRFQVTISLCSVAILLFAAAIGLLVAALLLSLLEVLSPPIATLITAAAVGLSGGLVVLIMRMRKRRATPRPAPLDPQMLQFAPALKLVMGQRPWATIAGAMFLGALTELLSSKGTTAGRRG